MKSETHTMPAHWASALINNDWSGLTLDNDAPELAKYLDLHPEFKNPVSCADETAIEQFEFSPGVWLLTDCLAYYFLRD